MSLFSRRQILAVGAAIVATPALGAKGASIWFRDSPFQGALMVGRVPLGARVFVDGMRVRIAKGLFAFGIARDQSKPISIRVISPHGRRTHRRVEPIPRTFEKQSITGLPQEMVTPPPEVTARIIRENAMVAEARKQDTDAIWFAEKFDWPASGPISGLYGSERVLNGIPSAPHWGVDIAAQEGWPVRAPSPAIVALAEPDFYLTGGTAILDHGHGVTTTYLHMSRLDVKVGDTLKRGDVIGAVGHSGRATGPHLHWALNWFQTRLDPSLATSSPAPSKA